MVFCSGVCGKAVLRSHHNALVAINGILLVRVVLAPHEQSHLAQRGRTYLEIITDGDFRLEKGKTQALSPTSRACPAIRSSIEWCAFSKAHEVPLLRPDDE
ncbi:MAG: hypothetical protein ABGZ23_08100 [Fuerstiella sp.]|nr:hypothetical protein [Fuerstiella sp.]